MDSGTQRRQHLDAMSRDVVYCHACGYEWYRDEYGLECPHCQSDAAEIVSLEHDPRPTHETDSDGHEDSEADESDHVDETHGDVHNEDEDSDPEMADIDEHDSDPEMADIDEHMDAEGVGYSHSTRVGEGANHYNAQPGPSVERFVDILTTIGMPLRATDGNGELMDRLREASRNGGGRVEWSNETSQGSVTFYSSNGPLVAGERAPTGFETFSALFSTAFRGFGVQLTGEALQASEQGGGEGVNLVGGLGEIVNLLNSGVHGDAVYSQEAMDRIVSVLMDANTQSSAAPPASEQGLANLSRRTVDQDLRGEDGKTECPICIEGIKAGEVEVSLPCKHTFHDECAVAWLKEHNTCPVCRAPIEETTQTADSTTDQQGQQQNQDESRNQHGRGQRHTPTPTNAFANDRGTQTGTTRGAFFAPLNFGFRLPSAAPTSGPSRPPPQSPGALNEAVQPQSSQRDSRDGSRGGRTSFSYDTSRLQRRSSMSPTSPRVAVGEESRTMRERSPSQNGRRTGSSEDDQANSNGNAGRGWFSGRFVGGNNRR